MITSNQPILRVYTSFEKFTGEILFKELIRRVAWDFRKEEMHTS